MKASGRRRPRIYYGWVMLAGMMVVSLASIGMTGPHRSLFIAPMTEELGFGTGAFGLAQSAQLVVGAASAPLWGWLIDRYGARFPLVIAGGVTALLVMLFSQVTEGWQLVVLFGFIGVLGLQAGQLHTTVPLAKWFVRKRARVMSLVFLGIPVGVLIWSPVAQYLIDSIGWRTTWLVMAAVGGVTIVTIGLLVVRRQPEDMGLLPDGLDPAEGEPQGVRLGQPPAVDEEYQWTRAEAMRSGAYWRMTMAMGLQMFAFGSLVIFRIPYFQGRGVDETLVALALGSEGLSAILVGLTLSFLLERFQIRYAAGIGYALMVSSALLTIVATTVWQMFTAFFLFGMAVAMMNIVLSTMWPAYFGRAHIGSIRGMARLVTLPLAASGAPMSGFMQEQFGTYIPAWWIAIGLLLIGGFLMTTTTSPSRRVPRGDVLQAT